MVFRSGKNDYFLYSPSNCIAFGAGSHFGLRFDSAFLWGSTGYIYIYMMYIFYVSGVIYDVFDVWFWCFQVRVRRFRALHYRQHVILKSQNWKYGVFHNEYTESVGRYIYSITAFFDVFMLLTTIFSIIFQKEAYIINTFLYIYTWFWCKKFLHWFST